MKKCLYSEFHALSDHQKTVMGKSVCRQDPMSMVCLCVCVWQKRLLNSIRTVVQPKDIDEFEKLVAPVEYQAMKVSCN